MPTYTYRCDMCDSEFEEFHSITEQLDECPKCKANGQKSLPPTRLITGGSFILLGSGWAKDNYS